MRIVKALPRNETFCSVVTADEIVSGWQARLQKAKTNRDKAFVWERYKISLEAFRLLQWLPFAEAAIERFETLKKMRLNVGSNDLRIAAIALENGATVVTRNVRDFRRVPELLVARWSEDDADGQEEL